MQLVRTRKKHASHSSGGRLQIRNMKTDLKEIGRIAKLKENENWKFRSFLKGFHIEIEELDSIVHELFDHVSSEIDCTKCANCCKKMSPLLKENDIKKLSESIGMSIVEFKKQFLKKTDEGDCTFCGLPCPFLENNICTQYKLTNVEQKNQPPIAQ